MPINIGFKKEVDLKRHKLDGYTAIQFYFKALKKAQMQQSDIKCSKRVGGRLQCLLCNGFCIKYGSTNAGKQRYKCKGCHKTFIDAYTNRSYKTADTSITSLIKEGCGIRSMARLLKISVTTVIRRILSIAKNINKPVISFNKNYKVDEIRTYYKNKSRQLWIVIALQKETKTVADFAVGSRTKTTLQKVTGTLCLSNAIKIYTDKLNLYRFLIPSAIHCSKQNGNQYY